MNDLDRTLADLARLRSGSEPIVSVYLDVRWKDEQQRERVRVFVRERARHALSHYLPGSPGRRGLAATLARVEGYVAGLAGLAHEAQKAGLALFACESLGLWRPLLFGHAFQNELASDGIPHLCKLARLCQDVPVLAVAPSQEGADIFHVRLGALELEAELRGFVPRRDADVYDPGAGQHGRQYEREAKDERRHDAWVQKNRRAAAAEVTARSDQQPGSRLVLVGTSEIVAAFERELPDRVRARVAARVPRPRGWEAGGGQKRERVMALAEAALARVPLEEKRAVDRVVGEALRGGLAVLGPGDVVLALNEGRVHTLVLEEDFRLNGWRCENCGAMGEDAESAEVCPFCRGDLYVARDLGEALVARALAEGGRVEIVSHTNRLHGFRGVGAFLRQTTPTGLRGASPPWPTAPGADRG